MDIREFRLAVDQAEKDVRANIDQIISSRNTEKTREEFRLKEPALKKRAADLRRQLAEMTGEEHAVWIDLGVEADAAGAGAMLFQSEYECRLVFNTGPAQVKDPSRIVVIQIKRAHSTKFGPPNDEALAGHPLYGRGLGFYDTFQVLNSSWRAEEERRNRINFPSSRLNCNHYIFTFHDSTFECLADSLLVLGYHDDMKSVWLEMMKSNW